MALAPRLLSSLWFNVCILSYWIKRKFSELLCYSEVWCNHSLSNFGSILYFICISLTRGFSLVSTIRAIFLLQAHFSSYLNLLCLLRAHYFCWVSWTPQKSTLLSTQKAWREKENKNIYFSCKAKLNYTCQRMLETSIVHEFLPGFYRGLEISFGVVYL